MQTRQVESARDLKAFIEVPYRFYKDDPVWIPPLRSEQKKLFTPEGDPLLRHAEYALYLLEDDQGQVIGRIAAFVDRHATDFWQEQIGFFGSYECIDDQAAANLLLDTARRFLQARGMKVMRGPINFTATEWGFVVEGYEHEPVLMSPYNPPYYNDQMLNFGMQKAKDLKAFYLLAKDYVIPERIANMLDRLAQRYRVTVRPADLKNLERDTWYMADIMNKSIAFNWGSYPITREESVQLAKDLRQIVDPNVVLIAEVDEKPIGFLIGLPDINVLLKGLNGRLLPFIFRLLFQRHKINRYRLWALGFLPEYHGKGLDTLLYHRAYQALGGKDIFIEVNYVLEDNVKMLNPLYKLGAKPLKTYRVYAMEI